MSILDINSIRAQFPALAARDGVDAPVFMDSPGGTQIPRTVVDAMVDCLTHANANLGGAFGTSDRAGAIVEECHGAMADFVNAWSPQEIIIGQNMTTLTFHISRSIGRMLAPGDEIIVTRMDHEANVSPWLLMARGHGLQVNFQPRDIRI